ISSFLYYYKEQIEKYSNVDKICVFKIDNFSIAETPIGNLFSLNINYGEKNEKFSLSPLSPYHYLVTTNDLKKVLNCLSKQENIDRFIKEYILHNILDYYDKNFIHFAYKEEVAKNYL